MSICNRSESSQLAKEDGDDQELLFRASGFLTVKSAATIDLALLVAVVGDGGCRGGRGGARHWGAVISHRTALVQAERSLQGILGATCSPPYSLTTNTSLRQASATSVVSSDWSQRSADLFLEISFERDSYRILLLSHRQCRAVQVDTESRFEKYSSTAPRRYGPCRAAALTFCQ